MKRLVSILLIIAMLLGLCSCGGGTSRKDTGEIVVGIAQDLGDSLNPYQMTAAGTKEIMFNVYEGLYKVSPEGDYIPALADSYTLSPCAYGYQFDFHMRKGVKFHSGKEVTGDDIIYSFNTCAEISVDSSLPGALKGIKISSLKEGSDDWTIRIELPSGNFDFLAYVSMVYIIPEGSSDEVMTKPVGTGPFKFVSRSVQENIIFERFDEYWGEKALVSKVTCKIFEDATTLIAALNAGAVDMAAHLTLDQANGLGDKYNILEGSMNLVQALYLNNAKAPFDNKLVRQAICYALDVDSILSLTSGGHGSKLGSSIYPSFEKYFDADLVDMYPHDTEKAKQLLAQAGYPEGFAMTVTVPSNYTPHVNVGQVVVQQLQAVGIRAELKEVEWNSWLTDVYQGRNFDSTVCGFDASTLTANALLGRWQSTSSKNMIGYKSEEYDRILAAAATASEDDTRTFLYKEATRVLAEDAANAYIQDLAEFTALSKQLSGYNFYPLYRIDFSTIHY